MPTDSPSASAKSRPSSTTSAPKRLWRPLALRTSVAKLAAVRLQVGGHRDVGIVGVLAEDEVERELARLRLDPLRARDRRGDHVRHRALAPFELADGRLHAEALHRLGDLRLVLGSTALLQRRLGDVEQRKARPELLV